MAELPRERPVTIVRDQVIEKLTLNYAHNNLDDEEFEQRLSRATNAQTENELMLLVDDLPDIAEPKRPAAKSSEYHVAVNTGPVKEESAIVAILSGSSRKGLWQPPRNIRIFALMGGVELDFTEAEMPPGTTEITVFTVMGGIDITVPPGLNVDVSGVPLMGGFDDSTAGVVDPNAPTLKVRGVAIMGGVDVKLPRKFRRMMRRRSRRHELDRDEDF